MNGRERQPLAYSPRKIGSDLTNCKSYEGKVLTVSSLLGVGVFWELSALLLSNVLLSTARLDLRLHYWDSVYTFWRYVSVLATRFPLLIPSILGQMVAIEATLCFFLVF